MKRFFSFLACLTVVFTLQAARTKHYFYFLAGVPEINIVFDYNKIRGVGTLAKEDFEHLYTGCHQQWEYAFIAGMNEELEDKQMVIKKGIASDYTIRVSVNEVSEKGITLIDVDFVGKDHKTLKSLELQTRKGKYGTPLELITESMERLGEDLGEIIDDSF